VSPEALSENERQLALAAWDSDTDAHQWGNLVLEVYDALTAELERARAENARLRAALKRFLVARAEQDVLTARVQEKEAALRRINTLKQRTCRRSPVPLSRIASQTPEEPCSRK